LFISPQFMASEEGPLMALATFLVLAFIVIFLFFLYQLYLVLQNTTSGFCGKISCWRSFDANLPLSFLCPQRTKQQNGKTSTIPWQTTKSSSCDTPKAA
jgi:hypothetical protein